MLRLERFEVRGPRHGVQAFDILVGLVELERLSRGVHGHAVEPLRVVVLRSLREVSLVREEIHEPPHLCVRKSRNYVGVRSRALLLALALSESRPSFRPHLRAPVTFFSTLAPVGPLKKNAPAPGQSARGWPSCARRARLEKAVQRDVWRQSAGTLSAAHASLR